MEFVPPFTLNKYAPLSIKANCFVKVVQEKHLDDLLNGNLYMNPFKTFKEIEDQNIRGDILEGVDSSFNSDKAQLHVKDDLGVMQQVKGIYGRMNFHSPYTTNSNIFCFSYLLLDSEVQSITIDSQFKEFGNRLVLITDVNKFLHRVTKGFESRKKLTLIPHEPFFLKPVEYVPESYDGRLGAFRKLNTYQWQKELRIAVYRNIQRQEPKPVYLRIGSIRDITHVFELA